ncbi:hypothetical protein OG448_03000 [Streptomyces sp. NBC_01171]|nr:hypothetical protein OG448_03000 [Streptomyces sp. NBC_01171]
MIRTSYGNVARNTVGGVPAPAQRCSYSATGRVDQGAYRLRMARRGHAAHILAGGREDEHRVRAPDSRAGHAHPAGDTAGVHAVGAAGEDEQRVAVDGEEQAAGDRGHRTAELGRRSGRGGGRGRELDFSSASPGVGRSSARIGQTTLSCRAPRWG